ncbi:uncharacterized protein BYT42DRAFT_572348 [Radiomyces spectabilis]|uniref:uncharacterized protein n=1 Tax=Radiomyces spectabilis TaxID=64574 RepID=UPI0022204061|nr:uncharacterized protein BYT42DRAFT_572348 [Radiomyces spectabilis]KAI8377971.1 hypothetical protein BYT42DRAFT_572348 [Radiomyces spectabilis]
MSNASSAPGDQRSKESVISDTGAKMMQSFAPLQPICEHVCGFHFYAHDMTRQVHAHHLCSHVNEDFRQCIIFDSPKKDARLIGIEYIISEKLFMELDEQEKRYWHSHDYEVRGGSLALPMPRLMPEIGAQASEREALLQLQKTYGKTWHTWQIDAHPTMPLGPAQLMMALTADNQLKPELARQRKEEEGIDIDEKKKERQDFPAYEPKPGCDIWQSGKSVQIVPEEKDFIKS